MIVHRLTALGALLVAAGLLYASMAPDQARGYEFPSIVAVVMMALGGLLFVLSFRRHTAALSADEEPIAWGRIWPAVSVFVAFVLLAGRLGFFTTSFLAFMAIAIVYSPAGAGVRQIATTALVGAGFMAVLYVVFVILLNVQLPAGALL